MDALGLNLDDIRESVRACAHIRVPDPVPDYLRRFLVMRLRLEHEDVAAKVARLSPGRCTELFRLIRALQRAGRDG